MTTDSISASPKESVLLLLTSEAVSDPKYVESVSKYFSNHNNVDIHRHVVDRVSSGAAKLASDKEAFFSKVYYLPMTASENEAIFTLPNVLDFIFKALAPEGSLYTISLTQSTSDHPQSKTIEVTPTMITSAIVAGFLQSSDKTHFSKPKESIVAAAQTATLLPRRQKQTATSSNTLTANNKVLLPMFKRKIAAEPSSPTSSTASLHSNEPTTPPSTNNISSSIVKLSLTDDIGDDDDDDGFLDENALLSNDFSSSFLSKPIVLPPKCDPGPGKRRRKACKDCSCGLREIEEAEEEQQRKKQNQVILNLDGGSNKSNSVFDDDYAIDFTVPGKPVGSCGSCALGDAFRCDGCPYLGLPPFKPGEIINISAIKNDL